MLRLVAGGLLLLISFAAQATTTTWNPSDKCSAITLSNGNLTATDTANANPCAVRATVTKWGGKYYYEITFTAYGNTPSGAGICDDLALLGPGGNNVWSQYDGVSANNTGPGVFWNNANAGATASLAANKVIGIAVDADTENIWVNTDVVGTPTKWNNSTSNDPAAGTGGIRFDLYGVSRGVTPCAQVNGFNSNDAATANFGATAFTGTIPTGFSSWNTTGNETNPNPDVTKNGSNAPKWAQSATVSTIGHLGNRVVAGPGLTGSTGAFNYGQALYLLELTAAGTTSATGDGPTISSCPSTGISDGSAVWKCLTQLDCVTITGCYSDAPAWIGTTTYYVHDWVVNNGHILRQDNVSADTCTSGGSFASTTGANQSDGTCTWDFFATQPYTLQTKYIPWDAWHVYVSQPSSGGRVQLKNNFTIQWWSGGIAQQEVVAGSGNETQPIFFLQRNSWVDDIHTNETQPGCSLLGTNNSASWPACHQPLWPFVVILTAAPGDSFQDNTSATTTALAYNAAQGVAIHNSAARGPTTGIFSANAGVGLQSSSSGTTINRFQIKSDHAEAFDSAVHGNWMQKSFDILDAGDNAKFVISQDSASQVGNSALYMRGTGANVAGVYCHYPCAVYNNTIQFLGTPGADSVGIYLSNSADNFVYSFLGWPVNNNWVGGFPHAVSTANSSMPAWTAMNNNASDLSGTDGASFTCPEVGGTCFGWPFAGAGNVYSLTPSSQLTSVSTGAPDYRLLSGAGLRAAGATFSLNTVSQQGTIVNTPTDILGQARPTSGSYDIGAAQFFATTPPAVTGPGRMFLR